MHNFKHVFSRFLAVLVFAGCFLVNVKPAYSQCQNVTFSAAKSSGCINSALDFSLSNAPANSSFTYHWGTGDSTVTSNTDVTNTFGNNGDFEPFVLIYDQNNNLLCRVDLEQTEIQIFNNPNADFVFPGNTTQCLNTNEYCFDNQSTRSSSGAPLTNTRWNFGTGDTSFQSNPCYSYPAVGEYTVTLQVVDSNNCSDLYRESSYVQIIEPPKPEFSVSGEIPNCPKTEVTFNNETQDRGSIREITYHFDDPGNTTETYQKGADGTWDDADWNSTKFTYSDGATFKPSLVVEDTANCVDTFVFESGIKNISFYFDKNIIQGPVTCGNEVSYSHTPIDVATGVTFLFSHSTPPNNRETEWSGTHSFPSTGVFNVYMQVQTENPNCIRDTVYKNAVGIESVSAGITLPSDHPLAPNSYIGPRDNIISVAELESAKYEGCLGVNTIQYLKPSPATGELSTVHTWNAENDGIYDPFNMIFYNADPKTFSDPKLLEQDAFVFDDLSTFDAINFNSVTVNFPNQGITLQHDSRYGTSSHDSSYINAYIENGKAYIEWDSSYKPAPGDFPANFTVTFSGGDSTAYSPSGIWSDPPGTYPFKHSQTMHDTDIYKPDCRAPNLVRFTNNSVKSRLWRDSAGKLRKREYFYIDTVPSDSMYKSFTNPAGNTDTLYYHFYKGYFAPTHTDDQPFININDSSARHYDSLHKRFVEQYGGHHEYAFTPPPVARYSNMYAYPFILDTAKRWQTPDNRFVDQGWDPFFDRFVNWMIDNNPGSPRAEAPTNYPLFSEYAKDHQRDSFRTDKPDDLSPWGSDSLQYLWQIQDPKGLSCTTHSIWASKQRYLYREVKDTLYNFVLTQGQGSNGTDDVHLNPIINNANLSIPFNTLHRANTKVKYLDSNGAWKTLGDFGETFDVVEQSPGEYYLRFYSNFDRSYDTFALKLYPGDTAQSGRLCRFSTAAAPYHYFDSTGCWTATLRARDTVLLCQSTATQRIFMQPPDAGWDNEFYHENKNKKLVTSSYSFQDSLIVDSLGTYHDSTKWAARILKDQPIDVYYDSNFSSPVPESYYDIKNHDQAWIIFNTAPASGEDVNISYTRRKFAIIDGDTFEIKNMTYKIRNRLPEYDPNNPERGPRRGFYVEGPECQFKDQVINLEEVLPAASCNASSSQLQNYGVITDSNVMQPTFDTCYNLVDTNSDGTRDSVQVINTRYSWTPKQVWEMLSPPKTFSYQTSGCKDVGVWVKSGNCIDTFWYNDYKYIAPLNFNFNVLYPENDPREFEPVRGNLDTVYCLNNVHKDTFSLLTSPIESPQEQIIKYAMTLNPQFQVGKYKWMSSESVIRGNSVTQNYDLAKDTVYRFCDFLWTVPKDTLGYEAGDEVCMGQMIWPELTCGRSTINSLSFSEMNKKFKIYDTIPVLNMGDTLITDSLSHTAISSDSTGTLLDTFPHKTKLWRMWIYINDTFAPSDTLSFLSIKDGKVQDTFLTIDSLYNRDSILVNFHFAGNPRDSTAFSIRKNRSSTDTGNISIHAYYKPVFTELEFSQPGVYNLIGDIQNTSGCQASNELPVQVAAGHYARFDPEVPDQQNDSTICIGDTVYFQNELPNPSNRDHYKQNFPRYFNIHEYLPPGSQFPLTHYIDTIPYWKDPKGVRPNKITDGYQYERLMWDLNGDGYYETVYDIDTLLYRQDKDMDSTFETYLAPRDVDGDYPWGDNSADTVPYYVYDSGGLYDVSMKSIDSTGCPQILTRDQFIAVTDVTAYMDTLTGASVCPPQTLQFIDSSVINFGYRYEYDSAGNRVDSAAVDSVVSWNWDFNDGKGSKSKAIVRDPSHVFTQSGEYYPQLIVETSTGCIDTTTKVKHGADTSDMMIKIRGPKPKLTLLNHEACMPGIINIKDSSSGVALWSFNKGNGLVETRVGRSSDSIFHLNYPNPGVFHMEFTVFDSVAITSTPDPNDSTWCAVPYPDTTQLDYRKNDYRVRIKPTDTAKFTPIPTALCPNHRERLVLDNNSDTLYDSFTWAMGNGDTLLKRNQDRFEYLYPNNAYDTFDIDLIPHGPDSMCFDTATETVTTSGVVADLDTVPSRMPIFKFKNMSEHGESYRWVIFDGTIDTTTAWADQSLPPIKKEVQTEDFDKQPEIDFHTKRGFYDVCIVTTNPEGCMDTACMRIASFFDTSYTRSNVFTPNGDNQNDRFTFRIQGDVDFSLMIYNRWGNVVYETQKGESNNECFWTNNISDGGDYKCDNPKPQNPRGCKYCHFWDGTTLSGNTAPAGTYYYKITYEYRHQEQKVQTGTVTLIR